MPLGSGLQIDPEKFNWLVHNVEPTKLWTALNQPQSDLGAGGAMDMFGSAASPQGATPQSGMGFASLFGDAPGSAPMTPDMMQMAMGALQQKMPAAPSAPAAAPRKPGLIQMTGPQMGRGVKPVPRLDELLGGR